MSAPAIYTDNDPSEVGYALGDGHRMVAIAAQYADYIDAIDWLRQRGREESADALDHEADRLSETFTELSEDLVRTLTRADEEGHTEMVRPLEPLLDTALSRSSAVWAAGSYKGEYVIVLRSREVVSLRRLDAVREGWEIRCVDAGDCDDLRVRSGGPEQIMFALRRLLVPGDAA